jgi:hypothetical protein
MDGTQWQQSLNAAVLSKEYLYGLLRSREL